MLTMEDAFFLHFPKLISKNLLASQHKTFMLRFVQSFDNSPKPFHAVVVKRQNIIKQIKHFESKMKQYRKTSQQQAELQYCINVALTCEICTVVNSKFSKILLKFFL